MKTALFIGLGGFAGSIARYYVSKLNLVSTLSILPWGTLLVNVAGSFFLGLLTGIADRSMLLNTEWRMFLMVGFCGGFTTFSSFAGENLSMMRNANFQGLLIYTSASVLLAFIFVYLGYHLTKLL
ncbi:MAG: fluoride efflux transporter CrcB [Bacteroidales bacterium]|jgi:CrcB protein|nr:fluoride efflux transporter CrcB [Bacteroidales bacterium]